MTVLIKISRVGSGTGPTFNLYASPDGITFTQFASGINKTDLALGYTATVPDGTTKIKVTSIGGCTNSYIATIGVPDNSPSLIATPVYFPENTNIWNLNAQNYPIALVIDSQDNVFAYNSNNTITKFISSGVKIHPWTTGNTVSSFMDMAIDSQDNIYTITYDGRVSRTTPDGITNLNWARGGTTKQIAIDSKDNVYITDATDSTPELVGVTGSVMKITPEGIAYNHWAITERDPYGITIDSQDNVYVLYSSFSENISKITPQGAVTINWVTFPGDSTNYNFRNMIIDSLDNIYASGRSSNSVYRIVPPGVFSPQYLYNNRPIFGTTASQQTDIAVDSLSNLYMTSISVQSAPGSDYYTPNSIYKIDASTVFGSQYTGGPPIWLDLYSYRPSAMAFDSKGNLYVACTIGATPISGHVLKILA